MIETRRYLNISVENRLCNKIEDKKCLLQCLNSTEFYLLLKKVDELNSEDLLFINNDT